MLLFDETMPKILLVTLYHPDSIKTAYGAQFVKPNFGTGNSATISNRVVTIGLVRIYWITNEINYLGITIIISLLNLLPAFWDKSGLKSEFISNNSRSNQPFRSSIASLRQFFNVTHYLWTIIYIFKVYDILLYKLFNVIWSVKQF